MKKFKIRRNFNRNGFFHSYKRQNVTLPKTQNQMNAKARTKMLIVDEQITSIIV